MRRREFLAACLLTSTAVSAQIRRAAKVAILWGGLEAPPFDKHVADLVAEIRKLRGRDIEVDVKWGNNDPDTIRTAAEGIIRSNPAVIICGPTAAAIPIMRLTNSIPIVFVIVSDPLRRGIVQSMSRPLGNATGFTNQDVSIVGKWIQLLRDLRPNIQTVGLMIASLNLVADDWLNSLEIEAHRRGLRPIKILIQSEAEIQRHLSKFPADAAGLIIPGDTILSEPAIRDALVASINAKSLPTIFGQSEFVFSGGLFSYDFDKGEQFTRAAVYSTRILDGEPISNLPVQAPTAFKLTVNMKAAKTTGIMIPSTLIALADEVIE